VNGPIVDTFANACCALILSPKHDNSTLNVCGHNTWQTREKLIRNQQTWLLDKLQVFGTAQAPWAAKTSHFATHISRGYEST
jgi:hypothetical protein